MSDLYIEPVIDETADDEDEETPELTHWRHPIDSTIFWCGAAREPGFTSQKLAPHYLVKSCPICADLERRFGFRWWWDTHCRYYESECHCHAGFSFHNCIAS